MKIDEGVNGKIHAKVRQILNSKAKYFLWNFLNSRKSTIGGVWIHHFQGNIYVFGTHLSTVWSITSSVFIISNVKNLFEYQSTSLLKVTLHIFSLERKFAKM